MPSLPQGSPPLAYPGETQYTGRYLMVGRSANDSGLPRALRDKAGLTVASASDFPQGQVDVVRFGGADGVYFEQLGVTLAVAAPAQVESLGPQGTRDVQAFERERVVYAFQTPRRDVGTAATPAAWRGVSPADVDTIVCAMTSVADVQTFDALDEAADTWGLVMTHVVSSRYSGRAVRVAVLDTGFDLGHPDFSGRNVTSHSFIDGEDVQDQHGHGTHCIGTVAGPARPGQAPRYGIAPDVEIFAGKVLGNAGHGSDGAVLAGMNWAITNRCRVVSMSLGTPTRRGQAYSRVFETAAQRALEANTLIIAAAGNESDRNRGVINPVGHPANCPSIMAVGAVDHEMRIATFSTRGFDADGGAVDLVAPGVSIYSAVPRPGLHGRKSGTSMATPHVAGIAALYAEAHPGMSARDLWQAILGHVQPLPLDASDAGAGFVQAPR